MCGIFQFDNIMMEEAAQILEIETFIPLLLQVRYEKINCCLPKFSKLPSYLPRGRRGRSGLPNLSHFSLFQAQREFVLHRIYRKNIPKSLPFKINENGQNKFCGLSLGIGTVKPILKATSE